MSGKYRPFAVLLLICLFAFSIAGCVRGEEEPAPLSIEGQKIVVWDAVEPTFPDAPSYQASVAAIVERFEKEHEVDIDLRFMTRQEIDQYLADGKSQSVEAPSLVHSTEWPVFHDAYRDVTQDVDTSAFIDAASHYWTRDGKLYGIPAYIHWFGTAVEASTVAGDLSEVLAEGAWLDVIAGKTGYWYDSQAFLRCVLDWPENGWTPESIVSYLKWVKEHYGSPVEDPLALWQDSVVQALSPVNPFLLRWINTSEGAKMRLLPTAGPNGSSRFYYTVPGYIVLGDSPAERRCAALLGQLLAQNLGRWAVRVLGCVPANVEDMSFYHLECGWSYSDRMTLLEQLESCSLTVPTQRESQVRFKISQTCQDSLKGFFNGDIPEQELIDRIQGILSGE